MKTINYNGNTYQIGALYDFSIDDFDWFTCELGNINRLSKYVFETSRGDYSKIKALDSEIGTITPIPTELIDGKAYQFESYKQELHGIYSTECEKMFTQNGEFRIKDCTNIQPLTVEIK